MGCSIYIVILNERNFYNISYSDTEFGMICVNIWLKLDGPL